MRLNLLSNDLYPKKVFYFLLVFSSIAGGLMVYSLPAYGLERVTLQLKWHHQFQFAGYYAAKELGYYKDAGLDVTLEPVSNKKDPIANVLDGGAQYGVGSSDILLVRNSGKPVVVLGVIFQHSPYVLIAMQRNGISSVSDLVGKRVMIDPYAAEIVAYLKKSKVPLDSLIQIKANDYGVDNLISGQADAYAGYMTNDPWYLNKAGAQYSVFSPKSVGIDFYGDNLFTTEAELKEHPARAEAFLEASLRGWHYALDHPDVVADLMISKGYFPSEDREKLLFEARASVQLINSDIVEIGYMHDDRWQHIVDTYSQLGMLPKNFSLKGFLYDQHPEKTPKWMGIFLGLLTLSSILIIAYILRINLGRRSDKNVIRISEIKHRKAQEIAGLGSYATDLVTGRWESSEQLDAIFGIDENYIHDIPNWNNLLAQEFRQQVLDHYLEIIREHKDFRMDYQIVRPSDGQVRWVAANGELEYDTDGKPIQLIGTIQDITERKLSEIELQKSQERLKAAASAGIVGVWDWDVPNNRLEWDHVMYQLYGLQEGDFAGAYEAWAQAIHPEDRAMAEGEIQAGLRGERDYAPEFRVIWPDNSVHFIKAASRTTFDDHGMPLRMIGINYELTAQKKIEHALKRESEKNFALLRNASDGLHILDTEGNIIEASDSFCTMLGYTRDETIGMNVSKWESKFIGTELTKFVHNLFKQNDRNQFETIHRRKEGSTIEVEVSTFPLELEGKHVLFCSSRDVSERKIADKAIRHYMKAIETAHDGYWIFDSKGVILEVNQAYADISGYTVDELRGMRICQIDLNDCSEELVKARLDYIIKQGNALFETVHRHKDGHAIDIEVSISYVTETEQYVAFKRDITARKAAEKRIEHLAFYDPLTHLPNRRLLMDRLQQTLSSNVRTGKLGALIFIDLDNFKTLNDTLGHDVGDLLLQKVAERLTTCVREGDTVSRLGGDEFIVMLDDLSEIELEAATQTETVAQKIIYTLNHPYQLDSRSYVSTPSIGATLFGKKKQGIEDILKQADIAMYQAKNAGRNTIRFFDPGMQVALQIRVELEDALRQAIELKQFKLYYQIQVDQLCNPIGAEVLIRWKHPEDGLISPFKFIPLAEETGLILPIGQWVLETACAQLKAWQRNEITRHLTLSVNVSAKQFHEPTFVAQVKGIVQRYDIDPNLLKLEPTESILIQDISSIVATMNALKEIGVHFSLDDFGTGFSSLQYLKKLPLDQLKIDQSFVRDLENDFNDQVIVRTIISMAQSLKLDVIAEGVETEEQKFILQLNGCNHFQGYLFGRPVPIEEFEDSLGEIMNQKLPLSGTEFSKSKVM